VWARVRYDEARPALGPLNSIRRSGPAPEPLTSVVRFAVVDLHQP